MNSEHRSHWTLAACALLFAACGGKSPVPAPSSLGLACGDVEPVVSGQVAVSDTPPDCGKQAVCLRGDDVAAGATASPGMCTCRCDGAQTAEPFCACGNGFVCREQVLDLSLSDGSLAGSYCVPAG